MSEPIRRQSTDPGCELAPVTCWPLILGAAGVAVLGIVAASGLLLADLLRPVAVPVASAPAPIAPESKHVVRPTAPAGVAVALPPTSERVVTVKRVIVGEHPPQPPLSRGKPREKLPVVRLARKSTHETRRLLAPHPARRSEETLRSLLVRVAKEVDLDTEEDTSKKLFEEGKKDGTAPLRRLLATRADLKGLPLVLDRTCRTAREQAAFLGQVSLEVRGLQARAGIRRFSPSYPNKLRAEQELSNYLKDCARLTPKKTLLVRPLEQMYQTEPHYLRTRLVTALTEIKGKEATQALARRAVFDLSPRVREAAVEALKTRELDDARPVFLAALRHPWPPAADHAALALVALDDIEAVPSLRHLLDEPDPTEPCREHDGKWYQKELVRVNHLRNCLLCHAPSTDTRDPVRASIPVPGTEAYYENQAAPSVRADVVYLRQDFSVMHAVDRPNGWPHVQRFDYMVRTRELKAEEVDTAVKAAPKRTYPQREAVRRALDHLGLGEVSGRRGS
jgi:hypothetical protein